ncbi:AAA family ATPase [Croceibacterium sp. LX-88]|uniref:AAA family ATPase n=1 Tax=Croceibacterium selenioxidans TaxID=2838833 RepID=A0ABS5W2I1_9SPHN|nr:AAA family ATPase [Croceibacterium selenioxidans]MBT2133960.1 AAA family ATPase [Croceibacterium selenioxidans]
MTSLPEGEGAPGWMGRAPKGDRKQNGEAQGWASVASQFVDLEDPGPDECDVEARPRNYDANDVASLQGFDKVREEFAHRTEPALLPVIDMSGWNEEPPPRLSAWGDWLPFHQTTMLTGQGGVGKSLFEQALFTHIALGLPFLGMKTVQMNTLYITCEDDESELWRRQKAICAAIGVPISAVVGKLFLVSLAGVQDTALLASDEHGTLNPTSRWQQLRSTCTTHRIRIYGFDNATDALDADHNDLHEVASFMNLLTGLAIEMDGVSMIIHHPNKAGDDWLGSVAWHTKVRSRLIIKADEDRDADARMIENPKANYGPSGGKIHFRWHHGTFVRDEDLPSDYAADLADSIRVTGENAAFLACLQERVAQGDGRAVGPSPGPNYAPAQFEGMAAAKGFKKAVLKRAMDRLFAIGAIESVEVKNKKSGRSGFIIQEVDGGLHNSPHIPRTSLSHNRAHVPAQLGTPHTVDTTYLMGAATEAAAPGKEEGGNEVLQPLIQAVRARARADVGSAKGSG